MAKTYFDVAFKDQKRTSVELTVRDKQWLHDYRGPRIGEPYYITVHRLIENYKLKDVAKIVEENDKLKICLGAQIELVATLKAELAELKTKQSKIQEFVR